MMINKQELILLVYLFLLCEIIPLHKCSPTENWQEIRLAKIEPFIFCKRALKNKWHFILSGKDRG